VTTFPSSIPRRSTILEARSGWEVPLKTLILGILLRRLTLGLSRFALNKLLARTGCDKTGITVKTKQQPANQRIMVTEWRHVRNRFGSISLFSKGCAALARKQGELLSHRRHQTDQGKERKWWKSTKGNAVFRENVLKIEQYFLMNWVKLSRIWPFQLYFWLHVSEGENHAMVLWKTCENLHSLVMANIAAQRIRREFKDVLKSEEVCNGFF